jgi:hypothetical protein
MKSSIESVNMDDGNIQKYQIINDFNWNDLKHKETKFDKKVMGKMVNLYRLNIIPKNPSAFGTLIFYHLGNIVENLELSNETNAGLIYDRNILLNYYFQKSAYEKKVIEKGGKLVFDDLNLQRIYNELLKNDVVATISGTAKDIFFMPLCENIGYPSHIEGYNIVCNSHFFLMEKSDIDSSYDLIGTPHSLSLFDGKILFPPVNHRNALLINENDEAEIRMFGLNELVVEISGYKFKNDKNSKFYSRPGTRVTPKADKIDYIIVNDKLVAINKGGGTRIPMAGFVIQSDVEISIISTDVFYLSDKYYKFGFQVGPALMKDGEMATEMDFPFYDGTGTPYPSTVFPMDFNCSRAARIGLGEKNKKPILIWAEGSGKMGHIKGKESCGVSLSEFAQFAKSLGISNLINLDGGGSAQIIYKGKKSLKIADRLDDKITEDERPVPDVIVI